MRKLDDEKGRGTTTRSWRCWLPLIALAAIMATVFALGWHRHLTLENIAAHRAELKAFLAAHTILAPLVYFAVYTIAIALSLPGGLVLTLTGGLLFGCLFGGVLVVFAATLGATIVFLIARSSGSDALVEQAGPWLVKLRDGFKANALSYLLFLRLVPAFPFWLVNLAPAVLGVPLKTYVLGTFIGIIPGSFAFASVGAGLDSVIASAEAEHAACIAAKGAHNCTLSLNAGSLITKELFLAFCLLGLVALLPTVLKKWRMRNAAT
jgi:uncharacterized membrane protein YdjX (TVP38/TMEM64 family)